MAINGFTRYVLGQLLVGMILVTVGLTCVIWLTQSLKFVEMIVNRGLSIGKFLFMTGLLLPNFLLIILPIALFTVIVFTYSKLINDRELVIMRGAGENQFSLAKPGLILSLFVVIVSYVLNLYLLPQSYRVFRDMQWDIRYNYSYVLLQAGTFNSVADGITVYVRERTSDDQLLGILVHDKRNPRKPYSILAERGALVETKDGARVVMFNGNRQQVDKKTNQLSILYFDRYVFDMATTRAAGKVRHREARERTIGDLFNLEKDLYLHPRDYGKFTVEAHSRLTSPLNALGFALVGLACLISGSFSRRTQSSRVVLAVIIVIGLQMITLGVENWVARNTDLVPLMYANVLAPILVGAYVTFYPFTMRGGGVPSKAST